ncbi:DsbA family protein [Microvirga roseola]|uniref:DsbA family protein n=1 Tax=Microvirga roseola TaxID=2883126 RepID=UPI001E31F8B2|nr:DsbA family protein [Microvirga roseola]
MAGPHLIYVADPMCSWCWGFSPVIDDISQRFGDDLPIRLVLGGLRPGTTEPLNEKGKETIREHWIHVHEASGQPFDMRFFDREGFVYDTEPACRAVVIARREGIGPALAFLKRVHHAFYAENRDVTDGAVLADLAGEAGLGLSGDAFLQALAAEETRQETWTDFAIAQRAGITGFPTLLAGRGEGAEYAIVTQGFQPGERIVPLLERWLEAIAAGR